MDFEEMNNGDDYCDIHDGEGGLCEYPKGHKGDHSFNVEDSE
tara:strand:+ start:184 stop:309 length:126 start_codon:yes stop_codon:yes gene_type:complete